MDKHEAYKGISSFAHLTAAERYVKRLEHNKLVLEAFLSWFNEYKVPKSILGNAINYCLNQWSKLETFLKDGEIEFSNNRAERAKVNNLNPFYYLEYLFERLPNIDSTDQE